jgi:ubiquinone/menaquinone biosynthesis C-methylase UbiE
MKKRLPQRLPNDPRPKAPPTHWGEVAEWYDDLVGADGSEYHRMVILPGALRMLKLRAGQKALDVACGQGVLCRVLHRAGVEVVGVDASHTLIRLARERSDPAIHYETADAGNLSKLPAEHFDAAACVLAIQNIHPLPPVMQSVARCLKSGGHFLLVMNHPCFRAPKTTSWGWDNNVQYRRVDRYLLPRKEPILTHPGLSTQYTWTFHRPLQAYVKALVSAGMLIDGMEEWTSHKRSEPGPRAAAENEARNEIPLFLALRARKAE